VTIFVVAVERISDTFIDLKTDLHHIAPLQLRRFGDLVGYRQLTTYLEPYLGFLYSVQYGKPSLLYDLQELYRHLMDDFVIDYSQGLSPTDFISKNESFSRNRKSKRRYLKDTKTRNMMKELEGFFQSRVEIPAMRHRNSQAVETLIIKKLRFWRSSL
jgi:CRISPR/Cas system-associated endonuclease Cas1